MIEFVFGYGPISEFGPVVPDFLVVGPLNGERRLITRAGPAAGPEVPFKFTECRPPVTLGDGWPLMFANSDFGAGGPVPRAEWFPLADEARWRPKRAQEIVMSMAALCKDPELVLRTVNAAGALVAVDVEKMVQGLKSEARPGESLVDVLGRRR